MCLGLLFPDDQFCIVFNLTRQYSYWASVFSSSMKMSRAVEVSRRLKSFSARQAVLNSLRLILPELFNYLNIQIKDHIVVFDIGIWSIFKTFRLFVHYSKYMNSLDRIPLFSIRIQSIFKTWTYSVFGQNLLAYHPHSHPSRQRRTWQSALRQRH